MSLFLLFTLLVVALPSTSTGTKPIIRSNVRRGDVMVGNYMVWGNNPTAPDVKLTVVKTDPTGLQGEEERIDSKGNFAFTVHASGDHELCFTPNNPSIRMRGNMGPTKLLVYLEEKDIPDESDKKVNAIQSADKLIRHQGRFSNLASHVANSKHKFKQFSNQMTNSIELVDSVSAKLPGFSVLFLVVTVLFLISQACYLKSYWKKKRLL